MTVPSGASKGLLAKSRHCLLLSFLIMFILGNTSALRFNTATTRFHRGFARHTALYAEGDGSAPSSSSAASAEAPSGSNDNNLSGEVDAKRIELWKSISRLEREAVSLLATGEEDSSSEALKMLAESTKLKNSDPFLQLAAAYTVAEVAGDLAKMAELLDDMKAAGVPPHMAGLAAKMGASSDSSAALALGGEPEDVDPGSTFSDTVTEKIRVKVSSFFDPDKSDPPSGKFMFWYKVAIYNEGSEPVQIVARMWEIEKCCGEKEVVRGAGIMSTQPIIPPGDVFTYQSVCPLKVFPPKGKRVLGNMSGAYTMCKGNMGQHNFSVKVGKFNLIVPESALAE